MLTDLFCGSRQRSIANVTVERGNKSCRNKRPCFPVYIGRIKQLSYLAERVCLVMWKSLKCCPLVGACLAPPPQLLLCPRDLMCRLHFDYLANSGVRCGGRRLPLNDGSCACGFCAGAHKMNRYCNICLYSNASRGWPERSVCAHRVAPKLRVEGDLKYSFEVCLLHWRCSPADNTMGQLISITDRRTNQGRDLCQGGLLFALLTR